MSWSAQTAGGNGITSTCCRRMDAAGRSSLSSSAATCGATSGAARCS
jgi:hypothetical protein